MIGLHQSPHQNVAFAELLSVPVTFPDRQKEARCMFPSDKVRRSHSFYVSRHSSRNITVTKSTLISEGLDGCDGAFFQRQIMSSSWQRLKALCFQFLSSVLNHVQTVGTNQQHSIFLFFFFFNHIISPFTLKCTIDTKSTWMYWCGFFSLFCVCIAVCINWSDLQTSGNELENSRRRSL